MKGKGRNLASEGVCVCLSRDGGEREPASSSLEGEWGTIVSTRGQEGSEGMCLLTRHVVSVKWEDNNSKREMQWKDYTSKTHNTRNDNITHTTSRQTNEWGRHRVINNPTGMWGTHFFGVWEWGRMDFLIFTHTLMCVDSVFQTWRPTTSHIHDCRLYLRNSLWITLFWHLVFTFPCHVTHKANILF